MKFEIPDALPVLASGNHQPGTGKACIMDAISIISGKPEEQDHPSCVHYLLRGLFITVNDTVPDDQRHRLWPLGLRAMGTAPLPLDGPTEQQIAVSIYLALARHEYRRITADLNTDAHPAGRMLPPLLGWLTAPNRRQRAIMTAQLGLMTGCGCGGCRHLRQAAVVAVQPNAPILNGIPLRGSAERAFELLEVVVGAFEYATGRVKKPPAPATRVDWDALCRELGTVPAGV